VQKLLLRDESASLLDDDEGSLHCVDVRLPTTSRMLPAPPATMRLLPVPTPEPALDAGISSMVGWALPDDRHVPTFERDPGATPIPVSVLGIVHGAWSSRPSLASTGVIIGVLAGFTMRRLGLHGPRGDGANLNGGSCAAALVGNVGRERARDLEEAASEPRELLDELVAEDHGGPWRRHALDFVEKRANESGLAAYVGELSPDSIHVGS
jgi:hypothetical protein